MPVRMNHVLEPFEPRQLFARETPDITFGSDGFTELRFVIPNGESARVEKVVSDAVGRTYVLASSILTGGDRKNYQLHRLTAEGAIDCTFRCRRAAVSSSRS